MNSNGQTTPDLPVSDLTGHRSFSVTKAIRLLAEELVYAIDARIDGPRIYQRDPDEQKLRLEYQKSIANEVLDLIRRLRTVCNFSEETEASLIKEFCSKAEAFLNSNDLDPNSSCYHDFKHAFEKLLFYKHRQDAKLKRLMHELIVDIERARSTTEQLALEVAVQNPPFIEATLRDAIRRRVVDFDLPWKIKEFLIRVRSSGIDDEKREVITELALKAYQNYQQRNLFRKSSSSAASLKYFERLEADWGTRLGFKLATEQRNCVSFELIDWPTNPPTARTASLGRYTKMVIANSDSDEEEQ